MSRKLNPSIFLTLDPVIDRGELLFGSGADGYIYQMEEGYSDDGDAIESGWKTGWLDMGMPETAKIFRILHLHFDLWGGPITVRWEVDHGVASGVMTARVAGKGIWGPPGTWGEAPSYSPGVWGPSDLSTRRLELGLPQEARGYAIQFTFETNDTAPLWVLTSASLDYETLEPRLEGDL